MTPDQLFTENGISLKGKGDGRYYTTCPKCSNGRKRAHQNNRVLGVTIKDGAVKWGCNHCGWTGPEKGTNGHADHLITYDYCDASGEIAFQKVRGYKNGEKFFWLRRPDGHGDWINGTAGVNTRIIYRLPEINEAIANGYTIAVVEGEKDADNLWRIGLPATCNAGGASEPDKNPKWYPEHSEQLRGADIVVLNDNDPAGIAHAYAVARLSLGIAASVRRLDFAAHWLECPKGGDVSDWLAKGHTREELDELIEGAPDFEYKAEPVNSGAIIGALTLEQWLERDLPAPDFLMGNWLTTTSRVLLYAPTGIGKTMLTVAILMASAAGLDFLHWRGIRPARVLLVDGEMSRRLLQQRLADESNRLGVRRRHAHP
jgi:hypothetical protein